MTFENVFYFSDINSIGGCESFFYYLSCKYKNMVVFYKRGDIKQIERLAKNVEVIRFNDTKIKCKRFFCCYNPDILDYVEAEDYFHIVHCDYKHVNFRPITHKKFNHYIGVSQLVCDSFTELTGIPCECIYNPIAIKKPEVEKYNDGKLHLISATRLSSEKGRKRMEQLMKILDNAGLDYEWKIFTNRRRPFNSRNVILEEQRIDIIDEIAKSDYLVQLSDHEAYCYSVVEALSMGVPAICTDLPVFKELGIKDGINAIICDFDMTNITADKVKKGVSTFKYTPPKDNWNKYLKGDRGYSPQDLTKVRAVKNYTDVELDRHLNKGDIVEMKKHRVSLLEARPIRLVERV